MTDKDPFPNARDLSIHAGSTDLEDATDGSSPRVTSTDLRHDAQLRGDHGYVHPATVRYLMRRLANHMDNMAEIEAGAAPEVVDEPWDEITAKHWKEIKGGLITIEEAYEKG